MRLIDEEALAKAIDSAEYDIEGLPNEDSGFSAEKIFGMLSEQPTISITEHGHWINAEGMKDEKYPCVVFGKGYFLCSNCKKISWLAENDKYCRKCGAIMTKEVKE